MGILIREYLESPIGINGINPVELKEGYEVPNAISKDSIMVDIEGIHVGPTRNYTWYTEQALKSSVKSWTSPYEKPLILHHNEKDGKIIGRVMGAHYTDVNTRSKTGALVFTCNVSDPDGKEGVKDRRLTTTSIGVIAHDVRCSICGQVISEQGECEHERGYIYNGETCYWMIHSMEAKELSYVIVPSDIYAHNIKIYPAHENNKTFKENSKKGELDMAEAKIETKEAKIDDVVIVDNASKITELEESVNTLTAQLEDANARAKAAEELKEAAEAELLIANKQIKEFAIEQVSMLREQLGRPALLKENLEKRSQESLMDAIFDLKEEMNITLNTVDTAIEVKESAEPIAETIAETIVVERQPEVVEVKESLEDVSKIEKPLQESLLDETKDSSVKKDEVIEKKSSLDVKESEDSSNSDYEEAINFAKSFYQI